jgi:hypothetical protein
VSISVQSHSAVGNLGSNKKSNDLFGRQTRHFGVGSTMPNPGFRFVRFEVFKAVTMKNDVFWDVMPCGFCKNRRFVGT